MKKNNSNNLALFNGNEVFVFGSNLGGRHLAGAAKVALKRFGAVLGKGYGLQGNSFAIPTKDRRIQTLPLNIIEQYVDMFKEFAQENTQLTFYVTKIGTGLASLPDESMARLFLGSPKNCIFDEGWRKHLGDSYDYFSGQL